MFRCKISMGTWDMPNFKGLMIRRVALQEVAELKYPAPYIPSVGGIGGGYEAGGI